MTSLTRTDWTMPASIDEAQRFAEIAANTQLTSVRSPHDAIALIAMGVELGLTPFQALRSIHVIKGKPCLSADLMVGLVKRHPACEWFRLVESTNELAIYETKRREEPEPTRMQWSIEDAKRAKLTGNPTWGNFPAAMLRARCSSALARAVYPDVVGGLYDPDEMQPGHAVDITPTPSPVAALPSPALSTYESMRAQGLKIHRRDIKGLGDGACAELDSMGAYSFERVYEILEKGIPVPGLNKGNRGKAWAHCRELQGLAPAPMPEVRTFVEEEPVVDVEVFDDGAELMDSTEPPPVEDVEAHLEQTRREVWEAFSKEPQGDSMGAAMLYSDRTGIQPAAAKVLIEKFCERRGWFPDAKACARAGFILEGGEQ